MNEMLEKIIESGALQDLKQIIIVKVQNINNAKVVMVEKVDKKWKIIMETDGFVGQNGLGKKIEGDMKTPSGKFKIGIAFGTQEDVKTELDYYILNENMYWICDSNSKFYNQFVDSTKSESDWDNGKTEHLIEEQIAYAYAIEIKYNEDCEPNKGSAIFLHCIKNRTTAGCVAIPMDKMRFVLENIKKRNKYSNNLENSIKIAINFAIFYCIFYNI